MSDAPETERASGAATQPKRQRPKARGERVSLVIGPEVMETVRDAVFWTPGETIAGLLERAILTEVERMTGVRGEPFPHRTRPIRMGRPPRDRR